MNVTPFNNVICPIDGLPLISNNSSWLCTQGHSFDIAKQGYTNLLPVQHKRSLDPGDHKDMVESRRRFLNAGYYQPIADAVNRAVLSGQFLRPASLDSLCCLDAGCGEGYYLRQLANASTKHSLALIGLDISKWAVLAAAKQDKRANWIVASNAHLPLPSASLDWLLCLFGFPVYPEFARVLKPGGLLLQVDSGSAHLRQLREIIYPMQKPEGSDKTATPEEFTLASRETVSYSVDLQGADTITDLLAMTPHFYRINAEGRAKAAALTELTLTVDANLTLFQHKAN